MVNKIIFPLLLALLFIAGCCEKKDSAANQAADHKVNHVEFFEEGVILVYPFDYESTTKIIIPEEYSIYLIYKATDGAEKIAYYSYWKKRINGKYYIFPTPYSFEKLNSLDR